MKSEDIDTFITATSIAIVAGVLEIMAGLLVRTWIAALNTAQEHEWAERPAHPTA